MPRSEQCRACARVDTLEAFCDLGLTPLANSYVQPDRDGEPEAFYPLRPKLCSNCQLVQLPEMVKPAEIFTDYPYFSSQSRAFVDHARQFAAQVTDRFGLSHRSLVVEVASNDGYLLDWFRGRGIRCYGVEPARNVALHAVRRGIATVPEFFDAELVCDRLVDVGTDGLTAGGRADLIVANNVVAHVPNLHSFLRGIQVLLKPDGVFCLEVPYLRRLVEENAFDTIYHEHFSYFTLRSLEAALGTWLRVFDAEQLDVHGGSLRLYVCHDKARHAATDRLANLRDCEDDWLAGDPLRDYARRPLALRRALLDFLFTQRDQGRRVVGYGAAAKGNTLLNYCGVGRELVEYVVDSTPAKQGTLLPGSRIPVVHPDRLQEDRPDVVLILPWNHAEEIGRKLKAECDWHPHVAWREADSVRVVPTEPNVAAFSCPASDPAPFAAPGTSVDTGVRF